VAKGSQLKSQSSGNFVQLATPKAGKPREAERTKTKRPHSPKGNVAKGSQLKSQSSGNFVQLATPKAGKPREAGLHSGLKVNAIHRAKGG